GQLAAYAALKGHTVVMVFDGGPAGWPSKEKQGNVVIVYVGAGATADDYIKDYINRNHGHEILLVSTDRQLCSWAQTHEVTTIDAQAFYALMLEAVTTKQKPSQSTTDAIQKTTLSDNTQLDTLMEESSRSVPHKDEGSAQS